MKAFRTYSAAKKAANGQAIVKVGSTGRNSLYIVGDFRSYSEIEIIEPDGAIRAHVTMDHLRRLGNANWAEKGEI